VGIETAFHYEGSDAPPGQLLQPEVEEGLYRIAQEALNNALRHARARHVSVRLRHDASAVYLEVADDGVGFERHGTREGGFGLQTMKERATRMGGCLTIESGPGDGTTVRVEVDPMGERATLPA
jgi:signal transduction histidine kinase